SRRPSELRACSESDGPCIGFGLLSSGDHQVRFSEQGGGFIPPSRSRVLSDVVIEAGVVGSNCLFDGRDDGGIAVLRGEIQGAGNQNLEPGGLVGVSPLRLVLEPGFKRGTQAGRLDAAQLILNIEFPFWTLGTLRTLSLVTLRCAFVALALRFRVTLRFAVLVSRPIAN